MQRVEADMIARMSVGYGSVCRKSSTRKDQAGMGNIPFEFLRRTRTFVLNSWATKHSSRTDPDVMHSSRIKLWQVIRRALSSAEPWAN